jgi:hypothetical protein
MSAKAWLDISVIQCPNCRGYYADASWYVVEIGADIECGTCHTTFNTKKNATDRIMLRLKIDDEGKVQDAEVARHLSKRKRAA